MNFSVSTKKEWFASILAHRYETVRASMKKFSKSTDVDGETGLMLATRNSDMEMIRILIPAEAKLTNKDGLTALMIAAMLDNKETCEVLSKAESDVILKDGQNALMIAAANGSLSATKTLLRHIQYVTDDLGWTALDHAANGGHLKCVQLLVAEVPSLTVNDFENAISVAYDKGHSHVVDYLASMIYQAEKDTHGGDSMTTGSPSGQTGPYSPSKSRKNASLEQENKSLKQMNVKLNEEIEKLRATDKRKLRETPNDGELEARIQELERENDVLRQTIQKRDTGKGSKHGDNLDAKYDDLWRQKEELEQELERTRRNLEDTKSAQSRVDDTEVHALRAELIEAREIQEQRTQTISALNRQIDDMRREMDYLRGDNSATRGDANNMAASASQLAGELQDARHEIDRLNTTIAELRQANSRNPYDSNMSTLQADNYNQLRDIQVENGALRQELEYYKNMQTSPSPYPGIAMQSSAAHSFKDYTPQERIDLNGPTVVRSKQDPERERALDLLRLENADLREVIRMRVNPAALDASPDTIDGKILQLDKLRVENDLLRHQILLKHSILTLNMDKDLQTIRTENVLLRDALRSRTSTYVTQDLIDQLTRQNDIITGENLEYKRAIDQGAFQQSPYQSGYPPAFNPTMHGDTGAIPPSVAQEMETLRQENQTLKHQLATAQLAPSVETLHNTQMVQQNPQLLELQRELDRLTNENIDLRSTVHRLQSNQTQPFGNSMSDAAEINMLRSENASLREAMRGQVHDTSTGLLHNLTTEIETLKQENLMLKNALHNQPPPPQPQSVITNVVPPETTYELERLRNENVTLKVELDRTRANLMTEMNSRTMQSQAPSQHLLNELDTYRSQIQRLERENELLRSAPPQNMGMSMGMVGTNGPMQIVIPGLTPNRENVKRDAEGNTNLIRAVRNNNMDLVRRFWPVEAGVQNNKGESALMTAIEMNNTDAALMLVERESGLQDATGRSALMCAAERDNYEVAVELAQHEQGLRMPDGTTALMIAASKNNVRICKLLSEQEGQMRNAEGNTALHIAANLDHAEACAVLVEHAGLIKDKAGHLALHNACIRGNKNAARALYRKENGFHQFDGWTPLMGAAAIDDMTELRFYLENYVGMKDKDGMTALMYAAVCNNPNAILQLLEKESGMRTNKGYTALMLAAEKNNVNAVQVLMPKEATIMNNERETALMIASRAGATESARILVPTEGGIRMLDGTSALRLALDYNNQELARFLAEREGIAVGQLTRDFHGRTDLMRAAEEGDAVSVYCLLPSQGGLVDVDGKTALMYACERGHVQCARLLKEKEARMRRTMRDSWEGQTALMFAAQAGSVEIVSLLIDVEGGCSCANGWTALMSAARFNKVACVEALLDREARMQTNERFAAGAGYTALMAAAEWSFIKCVRALLPREYDIRHSSGKTAIDFAKTSTILECINNYRP
ncbi:Protein 21.1 [Giardia duodenalis ATCC 50581]|uniref:Protein 21.1 n=2 Tax=Giardia intestinalis TaxID=5741 RepID=C6LS37_GIAIB|nr:Protein 21.1 [Giardia intestinalis ATCC 50581]